MEALNAIIEQITYDCLLKSEAYNDANKFQKDFIINQPELMIEAVKKSINRIECFGFNTTWKMGKFPDIVYLISNEIYLAHGNKTHKATAGDS